jgi:branched-chain amino acid transport system substrate-binding protein
MYHRRKFLRIAGAAAASPFAAVAAEQTPAEKKYAPGISYAEIKIGQAMPYSGPASAYGTIGRAQLAYFRMLNEQGGVNGRKINLISLDDGHSPPKTVEQIRRLVEQERVAFIFQTVGDVTSASVQRYLNNRHIPQLFLGDGSARWNDPAHFPWTMGWQPPFRTEAHVDAKFILAHKPDAKIAVLVQESFHQDYLTGLEEALGEKAKRMIVEVLSYQITDATIDSQMAALKATGADTFFNLSIPKFAAQAIRKVYEMNWKPLHILSYISSSVSAALKPAGLEESVGIISVGFLKFPDDPEWRDDPAMKDFRGWMSKYYPEGDTSDVFIVYAYSTAQTLVRVLKQCGDDLSRENIMRQAANLHDLELPLLLPGIHINTNPTDYRPVKQMRPMRFNGRNWELFGDLITG